MNRSVGMAARTAPAPRRRRSGGHLVDPTVCVMRTCVAIASATVWMKAIWDPEDERPHRMCAEHADLAERNYRFARRANDAPPGAGNRDEPAARMAEAAAPEPVELWDA